MPPFGRLNASILNFVISSVRLLTVLAGVAAGSGRADGAMRERVTAAVRSLGSAGGISEAAEPAA